MLHISLMEPVVTELEGVLFEMAVDNVRLSPLSFHQRVATICRQTSGHLRFDVRVDGDGRYQRIAAIGYAGGAVGILALAKDGLAIESCGVVGIDTSFLEPLENWSNLSLPAQAATDIRGHASLFLASLRRAGHLPAVRI
jgi:hypothetical protein